MECRAVSIAAARNFFLVAPSSSRSGKSRHLHLGLKKCADSVLIWKVRPSPSWYEKPRRIHRGRKDTFLIAPYLSRSGKSRHLPFGLKKCADSVLVWKVRPSPPWYEGSRRIHGGHEECFLGRAVSALVWKAMPSPPWYGKSRRIHSGCREIFLGRAVSALVWKVAPSPPCSEESRHFRLGLKRRGVSALVARN